jgi:hypothetical protein
MGGACKTYWVQVYAGFWVGKPEGKSALERLRLRWEDRVKMELQEVVRGGMDWIDWLRAGTGGALMNTVMSLRVQ